MKKPINETGSGLPSTKIVSLIGFFNGYTKIDYIDNSPKSNLIKSLRFPRDGLCNTLEVSSGCIHLACQTLPGFSGTPVFRSAYEYGKPLAVVGFLSQEKTSESGCETRHKSGTFAVSALSIK